MHWPERRVNYFGRLGLSALNDPADLTPLEETVAALDELVQAGKIRAYGLSNETPWGVMAHLRESEHSQRSRAVSIQNPYNLLNRSYEVGLAEISLREHIGLLAYSPLAFGMLSGKSGQTVAARVAHRPLRALHPLQQTARLRRR